MNRLGMIGFAGLFSGTFWQGFRYQTPQAIEDELKKDAPSLRVLLNEEDIIQEVKNGSNQKLQDFLAKNLNELIELITVMPEVDEQERGHKFPFVVSQILNCDCAPILDAFFQPPQEKQEPKDEDPKEDAHDDITDSWLNSGKGKDEDDDEDQDDSAKHFEQDQDDNGPMVVKNQKVEDSQPENEETDNPPESGDTLPEVTDQEVGDDKPEESKAEATLDADIQTQEQVEKVEVEFTKEPEQEETDKPAEETKEVDQDEQKEEEAHEDQEEHDEEEQPKQEGTALFDEEEEKIQGSMTQDSTTCFSKERSKYESIDKLFEFVAPQRPQSSASLASEATNVTTATEDTQDVNELNPVLCGYFAKLIMHFVMKRPKEFFLYISERPQVLHNMVNHIYSRGIADSLIRVLTCENHGLQDSSTFGDYNELRNSVVEEVLQQISNKSMPWTMQNAANIINDLAMRRPFFDVLVTPGYMRILFDVLFGEGDDVLSDKRERVTHIRRHGLRILSTLIGQYKANLLKDQNKEDDKKEEDKKESDKNKSPANFGDDDDVIIGDEEESPEKKSPKKEKEEGEEEEDAPEEKKAPAEEEQEEEKKEVMAPQEKEEVNPFIEELIKQLDKLIAILDVDPNQSVDTISGGEMQPFGGTRLSIVEMIGDIIKLNVANLNTKISDTNVMKKLLQFFGKYEWNSLLHFKLDLIFSEVLRNHETNPELLKALFEGSHFLNYITQLIRSEDYQLKNATGRRIERGFMPYIIRFIDSLENMRERSTYIDEQIKSFGEDEWAEVWKSKIQPKKNKYAKQLGGHNPNQKQPIKKEEDSLSASLNSKYTSYEKGDKEGQKSNDDVDQPEEDILNKRETDDDDDEDSDLGARRTQMLGSIDNSSDKHRNLYIQTTTTQDDDDADSSFKAWNVNNPEDELKREKERKGPGLTMEELSNEFDFARVEEDEKYGDFDHQKDEGFSADEFGEYQRGEEFFDAQGPEEAQEVGANEDEEYNDYNFWKVDVEANYDLDKLMRDM